MPGIMATPYPFEFIDHGTSIQLIGFSNNARFERRLHIDGQTKANTGASNASPDRLGVSLARWESPRRLVVETSQIDWPFFDDSLGTPQSANMHTTEVFTLSEDQRRLDYVMLVTDPDTFTEPAAAIQNHWLALGESLAESAYCAEGE